MAETGHSSPQSPTPAGSSESTILTFLNSAFGLALATFLFTTVFGGFLTWRIDHYEQQWQARQRRDDNERARKLALADAQRQQIHTLRDLIATPTLKRLVSTEMAIQTLGRPTTNSEREGTWSAYWSAYQSYMMFATANVAPPDRGFGEGTDYLDERPVAWVYFEDVINPQYERIHNCLAGARPYYKSAMARPNTGAQAQFENCVKVPGGDNATWLRPLYGKIDPWGRFKMCTDTFVVQVAYELQWRDEFSREKDKSDPPQQPSTCLKNFHGSRWCREVEFTQDQYQQLSTDCGPLSPETLKDLDDKQPPGAKVEAKL